MNDLFGDRGDRSDCRFNESRSIAMQDWLRRGALGFLAACALSAAHAQAAGAAPDPVLLQLGGAFAEQAFGLAADLCSQRVPASGASWQEASRQWREAHRDQLEALRRSTRSLESALKNRPTAGAPFDLGQYTLAGAQMSAYVMYGLAGANDGQASALCETLRARMLDRASQDRSLDQAQAAVSAALKLVSPP